MKALRGRLYVTQDWITTNFRPINQAIVAVLVLVYFLTLVFPFEELFGGASSSTDESKKLLSETQIVHLRDQYRHELYGEDDITPASASTSVSNEKEKPLSSKPPLPKGAKKEKVSLSSAA